jgi:hypothetical protein
MRLRLAKSYIAGNICPRRGATGGFKDVQMLLRILINAEMRPFREKRWKLPRFS